MTLAVARSALEYGTVLVHVLSTVSSLVLAGLMLVM